MSTSKGGMTKTGRIIATTFSCTMEMGGYYHGFCNCITIDFEEEEYYLGGG